jgi:hypothetical protein
LHIACPDGMKPVRAFIAGSRGAGCRDARYRIRAHRLPA